MIVDDRMRGGRDVILARVGAPSAELGGLEDRVIIATIEVLGERGELHAPAESTALTALRTFYDVQHGSTNAELSAFREIVNALAAADQEAVRR